MLTLIGEYSRFPFACPNITTSVVIKCLTQIFIVFDTPSNIHSDLGSSFVSKELHEYPTNFGYRNESNNPLQPRRELSV